MDGNDQKRRGNSTTLNWLFRQVNCRRRIRWANSQLQGLVCERAALPHPDQLISKPAASTGCQSMRMDWWADTQLMNPRNRCAAQLLLIPWEERNAYHQSIFKRFAGI
jgi:hypothetical protein